MNPFIVMCAPNGARRTKVDHPALPITPDELADCAESVLDAGAALIHVHVRDDNDAHSLDVERYRRATAAIRERVGENIIIQVTTEACGIYKPDQQMAMVRELRPEAVSVALKEICPDVEAESKAAEFYGWMHRVGVMAQHILYSPDDVARLESLRSRGVIPDESPFVLFAAFVDAASDDTTWAVCCFGETEHDAVVAAANTGGHARVGFENNLESPGGDVAISNTVQVANAVAAGRSAGREPAGADSVRAWFS
jgi:uncharacterized protein (DUF849 family)